ncbi:hypothetical protein GCM10007901_06020 [Dyella acidisoli]|uniref:Peptidase S10 n=2 Tax=Dyella acidisoli TaxID=1867834 RepID=A0ABQ5XKX3_9GAMM|nr:hypothetical protein GCM10007901_06020 [Dyella acidisoli]
MSPDASHHENYFVDNPYSLLDVADLVFIDPVGTGLSRVFRGGDGHPYWGPDGDAKSVLILIREWLKTHGRERSPIYIAGASYGGYRVATMMKLLGDQHIDGLILISPLLNVSTMADEDGNEQSYINNFPSMAVAAWFHHKTDRRGLDAVAFRSNAEKFAIEEYAPALQLGNRIPREQRAVIAKKIAAFIGLSVNQVSEANLRITSEQYLNTLLSGENLRIGRLDTRMTGLLHAKAASGIPTNDPSLLLRPKDNTTDQYFRQELKVLTHRNYIQMTWDINGTWNWSDDRESDHQPRFYFTGGPAIGDVMAAQRNMRAWVGSGLFDMATPWEGVRYEISHGEIPRDRVTEVVFETGHALYDTESTLSQFSTSLHLFIQGASVPDRSH